MIIKKGKTMKKKDMKVVWKREEDSLYRYDNIAWYGKYRIGFIQNRSGGFGWFALGMEFYEDTDTIENARKNIEEYFHEFRVYIAKGDTK